MISPFAGLLANTLSASVGIADRALPVYIWVVVRVGNDHRFNTHGETTSQRPHDEANVKKTIS